MPEWFAYNFECETNSEAIALAEWLRNNNDRLVPKDSLADNQSRHFGVTDYDNQVYVHTRWRDDDLIADTADDWQRAVYAGANGTTIHWAFLYKSESGEADPVVEYRGVEDGAGFGLIAQFHDEHDFRFCPCAHTPPTDEGLVTAHTDIDPNDLSELNPNTHDIE